MAKLFSVLGVLTLAGMASAQTASPGTIQATGTVTLSVNPDQAQLDVSVITQSTTAQQAAQQNAAQTNTVINALKQVLGASGTVQTINYSIYPNNTGQGNVVTGYTASNTVRVTTSDLTQPGPIIDTAQPGGRQQHWKSDLRVAESGSLQAAGALGCRQTGAGPRRRNRRRIRRKNRLCDFRRRRLRPRLPSCRPGSLPARQRPCRPVR